MIIIQEKQNVHVARHFFHSLISFPFDLNGTQSVMGKLKYW